MIQKLIAVGCYIGCQALECLRCLRFTCNLVSFGCGRHIRYYLHSNRGGEYGELKTICKIF